LRSSDEGLERVAWMSDFNEFGVPKAAVLKAKGGLKPWHLILGILGAFVIGVGVGGAGEPVDEGGPLPLQEAVREEIVRPGCLTAIEEAERVGDIFSRSIDIAVQYSSMVAEAAQAGFNRDAAAIRDITRRMEEQNSQIDALTDELRPTVDSFNAAKAECRA
jgi:hypothetical protein